MIFYGIMKHDSLARAGLYEQLARMGKVVVNPSRIELLDLLCQAERSVEALAEAAGMKLTTTSAHLQVMRDARLVETRRDGTRIFYRAASEEVCEFLSALNAVARARLTEVDHTLRSFGPGAVATERVSRDELLARVEAGDAVVLDVRPAVEYSAGHLPGARSVPLEHLEACLEELDPGVEIVAYCRGPLCLLAPEAVALLRSRGRRARCLEDGFPEWRRAGFPVAVGIGTGNVANELDALRRLQRGCDARRQPLAERQ